MSPTTGAQTYLDWNVAYSRYGSQLARYEEMLESFEKEHGLSLTPGAFEMLFVPLVELLESGNTPDLVTLADTFRSLMEQMARDPDSRDRASARRSSWSVVRAYWSQWCNIPPICGPTKEPK